MIFVMMGTEIHPFDRLARKVDQLAQDLGEEVFVQLGSCTYEPKACQFERLISFGQVCEKIRAASCVVTHAGAGSTLVCVQEGAHPLLVPRRSQFKEHVDEHQVAFADKMQAAGLATVVLDVDGLGAAIAGVRGRRAPENALGGARELTGWLEQYWQGLAAQKRS